MSQRLIKKATRAAFGLTRDGRIVTALMGSDDGDGDGQNGDGQNGNGNGNGSGGDGDGNGSGDDGKGTGDGDGKNSEPDEEKEALKRRMQAADRRASELERRLKEFEDKDKTELEKASGQVQTLTAENEGLKKELQKARMQNAFLTSNDYTWHDAEAALALADLSEVTDDEGNVDKGALKRALKKLAEGKPYLVKTQTGDGNGGKNGSSGSSVGSGNKGDKKGLDEAELARRYPSLAAHL